MTKMKKGDHLFGAENQWSLTPLILELSLLKKDMVARGTRILPIDANISDCAVSLIEIHALTGGLQMAGMH